MNWVWFPMIIDTSSFCDTNLNNKSLKYCCKSQLITSIITDKVWLTEIIAKAYKLKGSENQGYWVPKQLDGFKWTLFAAEDKFEYGI